MRQLFLAAALVFPAAAGATSYSASPAAPASGRLIDRDIAWACAGTTCVGTAVYGRPILLCQGLAEQAGTLTRFAVDGREFSAAELARCNKAARAR